MKEIGYSQTMHSGKPANLLAPPHRDMLINLCFTFLNQKTEYGSFLAWPNYYDRCLVRRIWYAATVISGLWIFFASFSCFGFYSLEILYRFAIVSLTARTISSGPQEAAAKKSLRKTIELRKKKKGIKIKRMRERGSLLGAWLNHCHPDKLRWIVSALKSKGSGTSRGLQSPHTCFRSGVSKSK